MTTNRACFLVLNETHAAKTDRVENCFFYFILHSNFSSFSVGGVAKFSFMQVVLSFMSVVLVERLTA